MLKKYGHLFDEGLQSIVQIKGKGNAKPAERYLPFVQDFVKSGKWGRIGDMEHTNLVRLPDGRYLDQKVFDEALANLKGMPKKLINDPYYARVLRDTQEWDAEDWARYAPAFEGFAKGGAVKRFATPKSNRFSCGCKH